MTFIPVAHALTAEGHDTSDVVGALTSGFTPHGHGIAGVDSQSVNAGHIIPVYYSHDYNQDRIYDPAGIAPAVTAQDSNQARNVVVAFDWQSGGDVQANVSTERTSTLQASQTPAVQLDMAVRRLTPTETERLQGFEDDWTAGLSDSARYRLMGNAVAVPVVRWIAERIRKVDAS